MGDCPGRGRADTCSGARAGKFACPGRSARAAAADGGDAACREPRRTPDKPDAAAAAPIVPGSVGHAIPPPGVGEPDGRKGIQEQVTPIGAGSGRLPQQLAAAALRGDQRLRPRAAALCDGPLPPQRQSDAVAQLAQHADRGDLDACAGADPGRDRDPVDPAAAPPVYAAAGRPHGQGDRPPMVLVLRAARPWRDASTATC